MKVCLFLLLLLFGCLVKINVNVSSLSFILMAIFLLHFSMDLVTKRVLMNLLQNSGHLKIVMTISNFIPLQLMHEFQCALN